MTGILTDIKRMAVHDGPGIRTTFFLKGCPLHCAWCHNPESISPKPVLRYIQSKCLHCGDCADICNYHQYSEGHHTFLWEQCTGCGKCTEFCRNNALVFNGRAYTDDELVSIAMEDIDFYRQSSGGVTLSGGEPLSQAAFCECVLSKLRDHHIHTAVDTCGFGTKEAFDKLIPYTDLFLFDIKHIDSQTHMRYTGQKNEQILENLRYLDRTGKNIEIRIPYIPTVNDMIIGQIGEFLATLSHVIRVRVLPYHAYAKSKYQSLNLEYPLEIPIPTGEDINKAISVLRRRGLNAMNASD